MFRNNIRTTLYLLAFCLVAMIGFIYPSPPEAIACESGGGGYYFSMVNGHCDPEQEGLCVLCIAEPEEE